MQFLWQFIHSLFIHPLSSCKGFLLWNILWKKNEQKEVYYFFKIYCKNPHFQIFIAALAGILACSFVIYSEHST